jgi:hypothetical protein
MYNVTTAAAMIAVAQQAIKKAPVTFTFPGAKSQTGLTVWINYDRFSMIGQAFLIIPSSASMTREKDDGFSPVPLLDKDSDSSTHWCFGGLSSPVFGSSCVFRGEGEAGCPLGWLSVVVETKKARCWQYPAFISYLVVKLHISLRLRCSSTCSATALMGRGDLYPVAVFWKKDSTNRVECQKS